MCQSIHLIVFHFLQCEVEKFEGGFVLWVENLLMFQIEGKNNIGLFPFFVFFIIFFVYFYFDLFFISSNFILFILFYFILFYFIYLLFIYFII